MAKTKKTRSSNITSLLNERNIMIVLAVLLVLSVAALIIKDQKTNTKLITPAIIEQSTPKEQ